MSDRSLRQLQRNAAMGGQDSNVSWLVARCRMGDGDAGARLRVAAYCGNDAALSVCRLGAHWDEYVPQMEFKPWLTGLVALGECLVVGNRDGTAYLALRIAIVAGRLVLAKRCNKSLAWRERAWNLDFNKTIKCALDAAWVNLLDNTVATWEAWRKVFTHDPSLPQWVAAPRARGDIQSDINGCLAAARALGKPCDCWYTRCRCKGDEAAVREVVQADLIEWALNV